MNLYRVDLFERLPYWEEPAEIVRLVWAGSPDEAGRWAAEQVRLFRLSLPAPTLRTSIWGLEVGLVPTARPQGTRPVDGDPACVLNFDATVTRDGVELVRAKARRRALPMLET